MKILGIDYGRKKIGLALADTSLGVVEPLLTLPFLGFLKEISGIVSRYEFKKIVIGNPGGLIEKEIFEFGKKIKKETGLEVDFHDETLTTVDAQKVLLQSGKKRKQRQKKEDAIAAALMLESYLEGGVNNV
ncbi:Holliday junction resolvase RuvX [Candidatus Microgenomates bacterium]|jgi:putative Holliday junction resolvase|nr:MAG: Holliday junction resolvase RuvX [Candidatus Microgenomates bacterium]